MPRCPHPFRRLLVAAALFVYTGPLSAQTTTPPAIFHPQVAYPIWISAENAEKKDLGDTSAFHPQAADRIRYILSQTPVAGCYEAGPIVLDFSGGRKAPRALQDAAASYPVFGYGVIRELTPGFLVGEAGQLARVEVSQPSRGFQEGQTFFVFIPVGEFTFNGKKICKVDARYVGVPKLGAEMLVFADQPATVKAQLLSIDYPEAVIMVDDNVVKLAPALQKALATREGVQKPATREELLALLPQLQTIEFEENEQ